jgi:pimeloyl-ACP methyl ester carboxylesterase
MSEAEQVAVSRADELRFGPKNDLVAWAWGQGPVVVLVHGWGGYAAQLAPLAINLAAQGFRVVTPNVTGHGASPKYRTSWACFFRDLAELEKKLGQQIHAYVGHSVGGLAMMAARQISGIRASRYVCICSPSHPNKGIEILNARIAPSTRGLDRYKAFVAQQFGGASWAQLEAGACYADAGFETLLICDVEDRFVSHKEADAIQAAHPRVQVHKVRGYGHVRILISTELSSIVGDFLRS